MPIQKRKLSLSEARELLDIYLSAGTISYDRGHGEFTGVAADGVEVSFGIDRESIADYLSYNPTPESW